MIREAFRHAAKTRDARPCCARREADGTPRSADEEKSRYNLLIKIFFISMFRDAASSGLFFGNVSFSFRERKIFFVSGKAAGKILVTGPAGLREPDGAMLRPGENTSPSCCLGDGTRERAVVRSEIGIRSGALFLGWDARSQARQSLQGLEDATPVGGEMPSHAGVPRFRSGLKSAAEGTLHAAPGAWEACL